jgi:uncharacterized protein (TIGR02391 family)
VLEACKSLAERLRTMTGVAGDGAGLVDATLSPGKSGQARVAINSGRTQTEADEQKGFGNLCKGLFSMFRNPTAHDPRLLRSMPDDELLEAMTTLSFAHRRLDRATVHP